MLKAISSLFNEAGKQETGRLFPRAKKFLRNNFPRTYHAMKVLKEISANLQAPPSEDSPSPLQQFATDFMGSQVKCAVVINTSNRTAQMHAHNNLALERFEL